MSISWDKAIFIIWNNPLWFCTGAQALLISLEKSETMLTNIVAREKYDKLIAIKRKFDPSYVFTANALGVDATSAPSNQCPVITEK